MFRLGSCIAFLSPALVPDVISARPIAICRVQQGNSHSGEHMHSNRRQFLTHAAALSCGALCCDLAVANDLAPTPPALPAEAQLSGKSLLAKMKWFNEPASVKQSGDQLVVTSKAKTD